MPDCCCLPLAHGSFFPRSPFAVGAAAVAQNAESAPPPSWWGPVAAGGLQRGCGDTRAHPSHKRLLLFVLTRTNRSAQQRPAFRSGREKSVSIDVVVRDRMAASSAGWRHPSSRFREDGQAPALAAFTFQGIADRPRSLAATSELLAGVEAGVAETARTAPPAAATETRCR